MKNFQLNIPTELVFGEGEFSKLGEITAALGSRPLLVTGGNSARKNGTLERATDLLSEAGLKVTGFAGIEPNPRHSTCDNAAETARNNKCDVVVALGGGSVMDAAKAISASAVSGLSCWDHCLHPGGMVAINEALPIVTIPTTAATGSEANLAAVITNWDTNQKCALVSPAVIPRVAICDPCLHLSLPRETTADGVVDIISHGFELYLSGDDDCSVQDRISEGLMNVAFQWGPVAVADGSNLRARRELLYASTLILTGIASNGRGGFWPMHSLEHQLSAHYDIPHGMGLAIIMPRYMTFLVEELASRIAPIGRHCFGVAEQNEKKMALETIEQFVKWLDVINRNLTLRDIGIEDQKFEQMAATAIRVDGDGSTLSSNIPLDREAIIEIYRMCLNPN